LKRVFDTIRNDPKLTAERFETEQPVDPSLWRIELTQAEMFMAA
jgi:hypothetical protein